MKIWMLNRKRKVFVSTWKTDNTSAGSSTDHQVKLPLEASGTYNFYVDWGDGKSDHITAYNQAETTHPYDNIGTYPVKITGTCKGFVFNNGGDRLKLLNISNWGNLELGNSEYYFYGCSNLTITSTNKLKNPTMTKLSGALRNCTSFNQDLSWLDSNNVQEFKIMFYGCTIFNKPVNTLNVSNAINSHYLFYGCTAFNQSVSSLVMPNNTDMQYMFYGCAVFNQDVSSFNTANVLSFRSLFESCLVFNQSVNNWNTSKVTTMRNMFTSCQNYNQPIDNLDTANVTDMGNMFYRCYALNQDLSNFDTAKVADMQSMFYYCTSFDQDISAWNFEAVTNMTNMFAGATAWSTANYDAFLISAAAQDVKTGVQFDCVTKYTAGGAAEAARTYLIGTKSWTINDDGSVEAPFTSILDDYIADVELAYSLNRLFTASTICGWVTRSSDLETLEVGFVDGFVDQASILSFCGNDTGYWEWCNQAQVVGATHALNSTVAARPIICAGGVLNSDGLYFNGSNSRLTIVPYTEINLVEPVLAMYTNYKPSQTAASAYIFARNTDSSANVQYSSLVTSNKSSSYMQGVEPTGIGISISAGNSYQDKLVWVQKSGTGFKNYLYEGENYYSSSATVSSTLTARNNLNIGCRSASSDNSTGAVWFYGYLKTLMVLSSDVSIADVLKDF